MRDLPGTYLVRVPGTVCHKALFVCEIKSPICFWFMPSLYLVKSASSARLFAGLQLLVLRFEQGYALQDERQGRMPRLAARRGKRVDIPWLYLLFCLSCREVTAFSLPCKKIGKRKYVFKQAGKKSGASRTVTALRRYSCYSYS